MHRPGPKNERVRTTWEEKGLKAYIPGSLIPCLKFILKCDSKVTHSLLRDEGCANNLFNPLLCLILNDFDHEKKDLKSFEKMPEESVRG